VDTGTTRDEEAQMESRTYGVTEIVGTSDEGTDAAIRSGLARAAKTVRNIDWFEVTEVRGHVEDGVVRHYQVTMKVGFRIEDAG
jgi:flavin-binding protein dodecin